MSSIRKITSVILACCLLFSLSAGALDAAPRIESVKLESDGTYTVKGSIDGDGSSGALYTAAYDESGKMTAVKNGVTDAGGGWSLMGFKASGGTDVLKAFVLSAKESGLSPMGQNDCAVAVTTMAQLANALEDNSCDNLFIADNIELSTMAVEKTVEIGKTVTISRGVTLTVPSGYTLKLNSGARLTVAGTLDVSPEAVVGVAGSYTHLDGENTVRTGAAELVIKGGTANIGGTLCVWPAGTDTNTNYDGGSGGGVTGAGSGGSLEVTGRIEIFGGYTDGATGAYNNPGSVEVAGYTLTVAPGGTLQNDNVLLVAKNGEITGTGDVINNFRIRLEGGSITGALNLDNRREIQAMDLYGDDGTFTPAVIGSDLTYNDHNGSGWIYRAAQVTAYAGLNAALNVVTGYGGENIEFSGGEDRTIGGFSVPYGKSLRTFAPLTLSSGSTVNVYGSMEVYSTFAISSGASLSIAKSGNFEVQCSGDQSVGNEGSVAVYGILQVGKLNENKGCLNNGETGTIAINDGLMTVLPGSSLVNSGTVTGGFMLVTDGTETGLLSGAGTAPTPASAVEVSSFADLSSAMLGACDALYITKDIEIGINMSIIKELVVPENTGLRVMSGATLTLGDSKNIWLFGWLENRGALDISSGSVLKLGGNFYNDGGEPSGAVSVGGTIDLYPGKLLKNYGTVEVSASGEETGSVHIGGTLAWGSGAVMPVSGMTPGYSVYTVDGYEGGKIVSTSRTAGSGEEYASLLRDESCDNIFLDYNMTITEDTVFRKSVTVPSGRTLTVNSGATLTVTSGAWLDIGGGTLQNAGTIVVEHEDNNPGHIAVGGGSVLDNESGKIEVYGELRFDDYGNTQISGGENITYHYYANLLDLSERLRGLTGTGYGLAAGTPDAYSSVYADWSNLTGENQRDVSFVLSNMTDMDFLAKRYEGDANTYLEPYRQLSYGEITRILEQLWDAVKKNGTDLPESVRLAGKTGSDLVCTYDYGSGSELDTLLSLFMRELGNATVGDAVTFTVNETSGEQYIGYKTFLQTVTIIWDAGSAYGTNSISFAGCEFTKGIVVVNSGEKFWVNLAGCSLQYANEEKACDILVEPERNSITGKPVFNVTNGENVVFLQPRGTTDGISVRAEGCGAQVECYVPGGTFTLNGAVYHGAANLGSGGCFAGKYQLDASDGGSSESFHAGEYTQRVAFGGVSFREFHVWSNIKNDVTLELNSAFPSGGNLNICDDQYGDEYGVAVTGTAGDAADANELSVYLQGTVDLSGLTAHRAVFTAGADSAVRFASGGTFLHPKLVGDYGRAAVDVGEGDLTKDYLIELYRRTWDENGEHRAVPEGVRVEYNAEIGRTYVYGVGDTNDLELEVTHGGVKVCWTSMERPFEPASQAELAAALYARYGSDTVHFTGADNAEAFVTKNDLMADVSQNPVTMYEVVTALSSIADKLNVTFRDYFTDNELARVDYASGISYGNQFEADLLELTSALALGSGSAPYFKDDGAGGKELAVWFDGGGTIGKTIYDQNGNTELSVLLEAFEAACGGGVYMGNSPVIQGATFAGPVVTTMGSSKWSDAEFIQCEFRDTAAGNSDQALNISTDCGANIRFDSCVFTGAASGFALNLSTVTANTPNTNNVNLSNIPDETRINAENVKFYADCGVSKGSFSINGAVISALDFSNYDGEGTAYDNAFFAAGLWWDDYENNPDAPTLGFSGGTALVTVPASCTTKFGAFNAAGDCPYLVTLNIAEGWTPDCGPWLSLRSWSENSLKVTGTITGGSGDDVLHIELIGTTDITAAAFTGNYLILTGKWIDMGSNLGQSHTVGDENISVINYGGDSGRHIGIGIGNTSGAVDSSVVSYYSLGSEAHVTIDGIGGIALTGDSKVCVGDLITEAYSSGTTFTGYTLKLYEYQGSGWAEITDYSVDTGTDSSNYRLVPTASFAEPYKVKLSVTNSVTGTTFNVVWDLSGGGNGEIDVSSESALSSALENSDIKKINIVGDITLSPIGGQPITYTFSKEVVIKEGAMLTIADSVTLEVTDGLVVNGTLRVAGSVQVYGWLGCGDWESKILTTGEGRVYTYADFQNFAIDLYNRYSADYGLTNSAALDAYKECYAKDYFENADAAAGITAINFLIENDVIGSNAGNLNGWVKLPYSGAMEMLDALARRLEISLSKPENSIALYGVEGWTVDTNGKNLLCNSGEGGDTIYDSLLESFAQAVGRVDVPDEAVYSYGLNNTRASCNKNYEEDVTVDCTGGEDGVFLFSNCAFGGDLTVNCGASDTVLLVGCTLSGDLTVRDDDGNTNVYFYGTTFTNPGASTVTVTEKTEGGAFDSARLGIDCDSVVLFYLPAGIKVTSDKVSAAVINRQETASILINGVAVTGKEYVAGDDNYYVTVVTCWQEVEPGVELPVLFATGSTAKIDATGDVTQDAEGTESGFAKFLLFENAENGFYASDTVLIPKAGSEVNIANSENARFMVSFDGVTVIDPVIYNAEGSGDCLIDVPIDGNITYEIDTGTGYADATPTAGKIYLASGTDCTDVAMIITNTNGSVTTQVGIDTLANKSDTSAAGKSLYAYVTTAPAVVENDDGKLVYCVTFWDGSSCVTANTTETASALDAAFVTHIAKNTIIAFAYDDSDIHVTGVAALAPGNVGGVTAYSDGTIQFACGSAEEDIDSDTAAEAVVSPGSVTGPCSITAGTVVMVIDRANAKGVGGGEIQLAEGTPAGNYIANCFFIVDTGGSVIVLVIDVQNDILNNR